MKAEMTIGIVPGYGNVPVQLQSPFEVAAMTVARAWDKAGEEVGTGYVSALIMPGLVQYRSMWGCPPGGEVVCMVTCTSNPTFDTNGAAWRRRVIEIVRRVKLALGQKTVAISFSGGDGEFPAHVDMRGGKIVVRTEYPHGSGTGTDTFDETVPFI